MTFLDRFDEFHERAMAATGFDDFGVPDYVEPLRILLADYDRQGRLAGPGAELAAADVIGKLSGRLFVERGLRDHPHLADAPIEKPLIIIGMPRSGTTALQRLIAADPAMQALELWLGATPIPRPPRADWEGHPVYQAFCSAFAGLMALNPRIADLHPLYPDQPDECRGIIDQSFWATSLAATRTVPVYRDWTLAADARFAYRWFRRALGLIAGGDRRRWLLKLPDHIFALDALLEVFPDACIVFPHRALTQTMPSVCSLSYEVLKLVEPERNKAEHAAYTWPYWAQGLEKAEAARRTADPARFIDLHNDDVRRDPVAAIERIYAHFDIEVTEEARAAWRQRTATDPNSGHAPHPYSLEEWGLSADAIAAATPAYGERYHRLFKDNVR